MKSVLDNYSFRHINGKQNVYCIVKRWKYSDKDNIYNKQYYTTPFYSKNQRELRNVLVGYLSEELCKIKLNDILLEEYNDDTQIIEPELIYLDDYKHFSTVFKSPLVVICNSYCDTSEKKEIHDIFYFSGLEMSKAETY